jgi:hypothetical protein
MGAWVRSVGPPTLACKITPSQRSFASNKARHQQPVSSGRFGENREKVGKRGLLAVLAVRSELLSVRQIP